MQRMRDPGLLQLDATLQDRALRGLEARLSKVEKELSDLRYLFYRVGNIGRNSGSNLME